MSLTHRSPNTIIFTPDPETSGCGFQTPLRLPTLLSAQTRFNITVCAVLQTGDSPAPGSWGTAVWGSAKHVWVAIGCTRQIHGQKGRGVPLPSRLAEGALQRPHPHPVQWGLTAHKLQEL